MAIHLNHTIVAADGKESAARFLTTVLGLPAPPTLLGPFAVVQVSDDTSLDFVETDGEMNESEFDVTFKPSKSPTRSRARRLSN
jgi:hypothetical protein